MPRYEVTVARYGTRIGRRSEVYLNHALYHEADDTIGMDYFVWVIRNQDHTIVVDTGFSSSGGANRGRTTITPPSELFAELGIRPEDAPKVVVTHGHYDHIGNLAHFDRSNIVIAQAELDFWSGPHARRTQFHHSIEDDELKTLFAAVDEGRVQSFTDRIEVAPGVEVTRVGGHTPGQSVIRVPTSIGTVLLASDAVHYFEELERDMPFSSVADLVEMYEGFDRVHSMLESGEVQHVIPGHDPEALARLRSIGASSRADIVTLGSIETVSR
ncbi:N-acyl homoserine lactonase family protein [Microbacterium sp.]|uniref:N-acyl homoserine lactonase family protein n=1 Tax=Microbacterium sp. TaxID=51671 RepID=UPI003F988387